MSRASAGSSSRLTRPFMLSDTFSSIGDIVAARAASQPDSLAYAFLESGEREEGRLTRRDLDRQSLAIAKAIASRVPRGSRVLLLFPPGLQFIPAFFGCLRAGSIALPAYSPSGQPGRD